MPPIVLAMEIYRWGRYDSQDIGRGGGGYGWGQKSGCDIVVDVYCRVRKVGRGICQCMDIGGRGCNVGGW